MNTPTTERCACCDLPAYSCGTAALARVEAVDPEFAAWLTETPGTLAWEIGA